MRSPFQVKYINDSMLTENLSNQSQEHHNNVTLLHIEINDKMLVSHLLLEINIIMSKDQR